MPNPSHPFDVLVAGAGIGGISAALAAARCGARTLLVEASDAVGGTGVHSPVGCIVRFWDADGRAVNDGLHREFFPHAYEPGFAHRLLAYDEADLLAAYRRLLAAEPLLTVRTGAPVLGAERDGRRIAALRLGGGDRVAAPVLVDGTADGHLAALAGCGFDLGRAGDGALQPATRTFTVDGIDYAAFGLPEPRLRTWEDAAVVARALTPLFQAARRAGRCSCPRDDVLCLPYPDGRRLLFNQTRVLGVDPTDAASLARGEAESLNQIAEIMEALRPHPGMTSAQVVAVAPRLGVREGRRIHGDHVLSAEECLGEARFPDMVAACAYPLDIHDPAGTGIRLHHIPGSGYYHIPYRCLVARDVDNLLLGSRCLSGSHEAHASYRVMPSIAAVGQAAGVAAALAAASGGAVRAVAAEAIRARLRAQGQFVG